MMWEMALGVVVRIALLKMGFDGAASEEEIKSIAGVLVITAVATWSLTQKWRAVYGESVLVSIRRRLSRD